MVVTNTGASLAVDETGILLHPSLHLVGVSIVMERERQQNDSLVGGQARASPVVVLAFVVATADSPTDT